MKTNSIKRIVILTLFCLTLVFSSLAILSFNSTKVRAEENFAMVEGASVYLRKAEVDSEEIFSGIKFMAKVPSDLKDEKFTVLILHKEMLTANSLMTGNSADIDITGDIVAQLMANYEVNEVDFATKFIAIECTPTYMAQTNALEEGYYVNGSMVNLPASVFDKEFVGFVYYYNGTARSYAALPASGISGVTRSISLVSNKALGANFDTYYAKGYTDELLAFAQSYGDERYASSYVYYNVHGLYQYYRNTTQVEVMPYASGSYLAEVNSFVENKTIGEADYRISNTTTTTIQSPVEGQNDYLIKNTVLPTGNATLLGSQLVWFDSADARYAMPDNLRTQLKTLLDAGKQAELSFYVYNGLGTEMYVYSKNALSGAINKNATLLATVESNAWSQIKVPLQGVTIGETREGDTYCIGVGLEGENLTNMPVYLNVVDGANTISSKQFFYTDEFKFVEPIVLNGAEQSFMDSNKPGTVTREITTNATYLTNGANHAVKLHVEATGRTTLGSISSIENCSLTNWNNVVLTADIYNASNTDLGLGLQFVKGGNLWTNNGVIAEATYLEAITLTANGWTTVAWSLKAFNISKDIFAEGITIDFRLNNGITYDLAIANLDFVDYSKAQFPDLQAYYVNQANATLKSSHGSSKIKKSITTDAIYMHNGSDYALFCDTDNHTKDFDRIGTITSATGCSVTDWSNVVLTADIYNASSSALSIGLKFVNSDETYWYNDGTISSHTSVRNCQSPISLAVNDWTTVAWSLRAFGIGSDIFANDKGIELIITNGDTYDLAIANLDFVNYDAEKFPELNTYYGTFKNSDTNGTTSFSAGDIQTITFDYCIYPIGESGTRTVFIRASADTTNILGKFVFDANGETQDYAGVETQKLATGYVRVVITPDDVTLKSDTYNLSTLDTLYFERWQGGTDCYYSNATVTYKA